MYLASSGVVSVRNQNRFVSEKKCSVTLYTVGCRGIWLFSSGGGGGTHYLGVGANCETSPHCWQWTAP